MASDKYPDMPDKFYEGLGWMHAECCAALDRGEDPRMIEIGGMVERCIKDLNRDSAPQPDTVEPDPNLCQFYGVSGYPALVQALVNNVLRLQEAFKKNVKPWEDTMPPTLLPAYVKKLEEDNRAASAVLDQEKSDE